MFIGARLAEIRKARHLDQYELAELAGTTGATVSRLENGQRQPSLAIAKALAAGLGCDVNDFDAAPGSPIPAQVVPSPSEQPTAATVAA